jgi:hypothetical protein
MSSHGKCAVLVNSALQTLHDRLDLPWHQRPDRCPDQTVRHISDGNKLPTAQSRVMSVYIEWPGIGRARWQQVHQCVRMGLRRRCIGDFRKEYVRSINRSCSLTWLKNTEHGFSHVLSKQTLLLSLPNIAVDFPEKHGSQRIVRSLSGRQKML